ncbi:MAG: hydrolase [Candidatus Bathyarchaeia archaeon]|nr:hydrolase [Candidatus Bathyarchaeota archaeon]
MPSRKYIHAPTFILANVIVDLEPFLAFFFRLRYPLHGHMHTFILALPMSMAFGGTMYFLEKFPQPLYKVLLLENTAICLKSFVAAGILGWMLHVFFDAPLYSDIKPFYPMTANPLYNPDLTLVVYNLCIWLGALGTIYYIALLSISIYRSLYKRDEYFRKPNNFARNLISTVCS